MFLVKIVGPSAYIVVQDWPRAGLGKVYDMSAAVELKGRPVVPVEPPLPFACFAEATAERQPHRSPGSVRCKARCTLGDDAGDRLVDAEMVRGPQGPLRSLQMSAGFRSSVYPRTTWLCFRAALCFRDADDQTVRHGNRRLHEAICASIARPD